MIPTLAQVSVLDSPFEKDVSDFASAGCPAIEMWWGKLDNYLAKHRPSDLQRLLEKHKIVAPVASYVGGLLTNQLAAREVAWELFGQRLITAGAIGVKTLVVAADIAGRQASSDFDRIKDLLRQAADAASVHDMRIAIEFQASSAFCNNLQTAVAIAEMVDHSALGICLDAFHFFVGPSKTEDLSLLHNENLFHVQLCDLAGVTREAASDGDRVLPGDGDYSPTPIMDRLRAIDYQASVSIELLNPKMFRIPAISFGEVAIAALRKAMYVG